MAQKKLNEVSPTMCLAKWNQVSLHLPTGLTNSCYHPPLHKIDATKLDITCYISISKNIISSYNAKNLSKEINKKFDGKGGGSDTFATIILTKVKTEDVKAYITKIL